MNNLTNDCHYLFSLLCLVVMALLFLQQANAEQMTHMAIYDSVQSKSNESRIIKVEELPHKTYLLSTYNFTSKDKALLALDKLKQLTKAYLIKESGKYAVEKHKLQMKLWLKEKQHDGKSYYAIEIATAQSKRALEILRNIFKIKANIKSYSIII